jgi:hypothetical protein
VRNSSSGPALLGASCGPRVAACECTQGIQFHHTAAELLKECRKGHASTPTSGSEQRSAVRVKGGMAWGSCLRGYRPAYYEALPPPSPSPQTDHFADLTAAHGRAQSCPTGSDGPRRTSARSSSTSHWTTSQSRPQPTALRSLTTGTPCPSSVDELRRSLSTNSHLRSALLRLLALDEDTQASATRRVASIYPPTGTCDLGDAWP